jgi:DNA-binding transcriptional MocR family regulator
MTTSLVNLERASEICASHGVLHALDVAYCELRYDGRDNQLVDLGRFPETTCLFGSFTKTLSPGAKCGFGVFPEKVLECLVPVIANTRLNPNYPTQAAIHQLMESGFYDKHLSFLVDLYRPRMEAVNQAFQTHLPELEIPHLTGGFFVGLFLTGVSDAHAFVEAVASRGVVLAPATVFAPGWEKYYSDKYEGVFFRLTFPFQPARDNEQGIARIAETYREFVPA